MSASSDSGVNPEKKQALAKTSIPEYKHQLSDVKLPAQTFNSSLISTEISSKVQYSLRSRDDFEKLEQIGEGAYGKVYRARDKKTGDIVAMKKVRMRPTDGFPITAIREIKILRHLNHENIVRLKEIVTSKNKNIYMVMEYMEFDLSGIMGNPALNQLSPAQIKSFMKQLMEAMCYCHSEGILHRDLKCSNILINAQNVLKLADFGLARFFEDDFQMSNYVITRWYRPPELLLGATQYTMAVDMWSVGCIFAELILRKPLIPGKNDIEQLEKIFQLCGTPDVDAWSSASDLVNWEKLQPKKKHSRKIRQSFQEFFHPDALDLLDRLLRLDPTKRLTAPEVMQHPYFTSDEIPLLTPSQLPKLDCEGCHEFQIKKKRPREKTQDKSAEKEQSDSKKRRISESTIPSTNSGSSNAAVAPVSPSKEAARKPVVQPAVSKPAEQAVKVPPQPFQPAATVHENGTTKHQQVSAATSTAAESSTKPAESRKDSKHESKSSEKSSSSKRERHHSPERSSRREERRHKEERRRSPSPSRERKSRDGSRKERRRSYSPHRRHRSRTPDRHERYEKYDKLDKHGSSSRRDETHGSRSSHSSNHSSSSTRRYEDDRSRRKRRSSSRSPSPRRERRSHKH